MRLSIWVLPAALTLAFTSPQAKAQQTTDTNCNLNGNTANCTSTTTDNSVQQRQAYEAGQQVGNALGLGIAALIRGNPQAKSDKKHDKWVKEYCAAHPGAGWHTANRVTGAIIMTGKCPTDADKGVEAANLFMSKHRDYVPGPENSKVMVAYIESHNLDPREESTYERVYKDLKKSGQLHLYSK